jgi:hypothetical protein
LAPKILEDLATTFSSNIALFPSSITLNLHAQSKRGDRIPTLF